MSTLTDAVSSEACYVRCGMPLRTSSRFGSSELPRGLQLRRFACGNGADGGAARVWDAANGAAIGEPLQHDDAVESAEFSPDGKRVVTAFADKTARCLNTPAPKGYSVGRRRRVASIGNPLRHSQSIALNVASSANIA
jgi:WD40 repeat protein